MKFWGKMSGIWKKTKINLGGNGGIFLGGKKGRIWEIWVKNQNLDEKKIE